MDLREWYRCAPRHKNMLILSKTHFSVMEKYVEGARQDEKHVPDVLEAIVKPSGLVKGELRQILFKDMQFGSKIEKFKVSTF